HLNRITPVPKVETRLHLVNLLGYAGIDTDSGISLLVRLCHQKLINFLINKPIHGAG
ncbi:unnamed protein product, partial [marine sediment metagenome]